MAKVLVADDDPGTVKFVEELLKGEGHVVQTAADGATALDKAQRMKPDILITDLRMPGLSGNQLASAVRSLDRMQYMYIVVLTVSGEKADRMKAFLSGADDFIVKPARAGELVGRIEVGLRIQKAEKAARAATAAAEEASGLLASIVQEVDAIAAHVGSARAVAARSGNAALLQSTEEALVGAERAAKAIRQRLEGAGQGTPPS